MSNRSGRGATRRARVEAPGRRPGRHLPLRHVRLRPRRPRRRRPSGPSHRRRRCRPCIDLLPTPDAPQPRRRERRFLLALARPRRPRRPGPHPRSRLPPSAAGLSPSASPQRLADGRHRVGHAGRARGRLLVQGARASSAARSSTRLDAGRASRATAGWCVERRASPRPSRPSSASSSTEMCRALDAERVRQGREQRCARARGGDQPAALDARARRSTAPSLHRQRPRQGRERLAPERDLELAPGEAWDQARTWVLVAGGDSFTDRGVYDTRRAQGQGRGLPLRRRHGQGHRAWLLRPGLQRQHRARATCSPATRARCASSSRAPSWPSPTTSSP